MKPITPSTFFHFTAPLDKSNALLAAASARRKVLRTSLGLALAVCAAGAQAQATQPVTLKFHTFMAPQSNVWINMHKAWMAKVEKESAGRIKFEAYPAMQLGGTPAQLFDQARDGVVDIVWTLPGYTAGRFPRTEVFELPFMMNNAEATSKAFWEYLQTQAPDEYKDVQLLAAQVHGPGVFHTKSKQIKTADDMQGMKLRGPSRMATKMLGYLGAVPVGMPLPSIPDALSKGTIDGAMLPWEVVPSVKVHELSKSHSEFDPAGGALYTSTFVMVMNKNKYNALPADLKKVIDANSGLQTSGWLGKIQQAGDMAGRKSALDRGNNVYTIPAAEAQEFRRKARFVEVEWMEDMQKRGYDGKKLLASAHELVEKYGKKPVGQANAKPASLSPAGSKSIKK